MGPVRREFAVAGRQAWLNDPSGIHLKSAWTFGGQPRFGGQSPGERFSRRTEGAAMKMSYSIRRIRAAWHTRAMPSAPASGFGRLP